MQSTCAPSQMPSCTSWWSPNGHSHQANVECTATAKANSKSMQFQTIILHILLAKPELHNQFFIGATVSVLLCPPHSAVVLHMSVANAMNSFTPFPPLATLTSSQLSLWLHVTLVPMVNTYAKLIALQHNCPSSDHPQNAWRLPMVVQAGAIHKSWLPFLQLSEHAS